MSELFENQTISMEDLPQINQQAFKTIEKRYKYFLHIRNFVLIALVSVLIIAFQIFKESELETWYFAGVYIGLFIFWVLNFIFVELGFPRKSYLLRHHDLIYKTGYLMQKMTAIPKNRIQHVEIRQSLFLRIFSLSKLVIYTAGGSSSDLSISGLTPENADLLKEHISKAISEYE